MDLTELPFSEACARNIDPIKSVLNKYLKEGSVFEMGFGTGQHAIDLSKEFPDVQWYAADQKDYHWILQRRMELSPRPNLHGPYEMLIHEDCKMREQLPSIEAAFDAFFTANTLHIMNQREVDLFCSQVGDCLKEEGKLFIYGPFQYDGQFTSESNEHFHASLMSRGVGSGIKEFNRLTERLVDFTFKERFDLPSNNQMLLFKKKS